MTVRTGPALILGLALAAVCRAEGPTPPERLIVQLGSAVHGEREAAARELESRGADILPTLRKAQPHPDAEVRQRLAHLIEVLERVTLLAPKRVSVHFHRVPVKEALAELGRQSGYRLELQGGATQLVTLDADDAFWPALDGVCRQAGLTVQQHHDGSGTMYLYAQNSFAPFVDYQGVFRLSATGFNYNKSLSFAQLPLTASAGLGGQRTEMMSLQFNVCAEPKTPLLGVGQPKLTAAVDDRGSSLLITGGREHQSNYGGYHGGYRSFLLQTQVPLRGPSPEARSLKLVRGSLPVTFLAEQRADIVIDEILSVKNRKFEGPQVGIDIEETKELAGKQVHIMMTVRRTAKDGQQDYTWTNSLHQRLELQDAQGRKYQSNGFNWSEGNPQSVRGTMMFADSGAAGLGKPARLIYYHWVTTQHPLEFEFHDLPLP